MSGELDFAVDGFICWLFVTVRVMRPCPRLPLRGPSFHNVVAQGVD